MQRLKCVFNIDIEACEYCGGQVKVIASIEDPMVIEYILKYLKQKAANTDTTNFHTLPPAKYFLKRRAKCPIMQPFLRRICLCIGRRRRKECDAGHASGITIIFRFKRIQRNRENL